MKTLIRCAGSLLQFFPLTVFLTVAFHDGRAQGPDWKKALVWGGAAALLQIALLRWPSRTSPLNRIILGVNCYLILAGAAVLSHQWAFLTVLDDLKESGLLISVLIVGLVTTVASPAGFVGTIAPLPNRLRLYSLQLLGLTGVAVLASFRFRGQLIFSAAVPLILLTIASRSFQKQLQRGQGARTPNGPP